MRKLQKIKALDDFTLNCLFEGGVQKIADIKPYLQTEAFTPLNDLSIFKMAKNKAYYISWLHEQIEISADTLWHIGVEVIGRRPSLAFSGEK